MLVVDILEHRLTINFVSNKAQILLKTIFLQFSTVANRMRSRRGSKSRQRYCGELPHHDISIPHPSSWVFNCDCHFVVSLQFLCNKKIEFHQQLICFVRLWSLVVVVIISMFPPSQIRICAAHWRGMDVIESQRR